MAASLSSILPSLANFDVRNTLPELQHDFGALWDAIEQAPNDQVPTEIRDNMLILYDALNGTASSNTCPVLPDTSSGSTSPDHEVVDEDSKTRTIILSPASHCNPSLSISSIPKSTRCPTADATSSDLTSLCLESHSRSDTSDSQVLTTATMGEIADTPSRAQPTIRSNLGATASPTMVTSHLSHGIVESSPPISTSAPHSIPQSTGTAPLFAHHCARDMNDRIEMKSPLRTRSTRHSASSESDNVEEISCDPNRL
ncbi:hypothetical protein BGW80DRAFT_1341293 [Lactifluus volemus]|nr:hypothetical protein BGW80DRAFT_1341293 [Lactifluus volemus]